MRTLPFSLLVLACFAALVALRAALPGIAAQAPRPSLPPGEAMAVPPKPTGLQLPEREAAEGVGAGGIALTLEACQRLAPALRDLCLQSLSHQQARSSPDPAGALATCALIRDPEIALECRSDTAEILALSDREGAARICDGIDSPRWRGQCRFGVGLSLAEIDPTAAFAQCDEAGIFRLFCRHDVIGEIALASAPDAHALCLRDDTPDQPELARRTCWHGIGKYLARRDPAEAARACLAAPDPWIGSCFHGLGWGASERDPDAALAFCDAQPWRDHCRQGVAHHQKRLDPARALDLCRSIGTASVRDRCLDFVTR